MTIIVFLFIGFTFRHSILSATDLERCDSIECLFYFRRITTKSLSLSNKVMTVREVAEAMGVSKDTVLNCIKRIMPNILQHGKTTFLTETQVSLISKELKSNNTVTDRLTVEVSSTPDDVN